MAASGGGGGVAGGGGGGACCAHAKVVVANIRSTAGTIDIVLWFMESPWEKRHQMPLLVGG
jgi:hypothetical protein